MKIFLSVMCLLLLVSCGPSQEEKEKIAAVTCSIMGESRNVDGAVRVGEINEAREKIGGEAYLGGDDKLKEAFEWGLCQELVLNENYDESLENLKDAKRERERMAAKNQRIADSKPTVKEVFYSNGQLKERTNYQSKDDAGELHGLARGWHKNGKLESERTYENGKPHGLHRWWHENGQLRGECPYKDGKGHGLKRWWHKNGKLESERTYENGKPQGLARQWHENGQLGYENPYENGKKHGLARQWHENGQLEHENPYENGEKHGLQRAWYENGQLAYDWCYSNGKSVAISNCQE